MKARFPPENAATLIDCHACQTPISGALVGTICGKICPKLFPTNFPKWRKMAELRGFGGLKCRNWSGREDFILIAHKPRKSLIIYVLQGP
jgi:hypothetical protein